LGLIDRADGPTITTIESQTTVSISNSKTEVFFDLIYLFGRKIARSTSALVRAKALTLVGGLKRQSTAKERANFHVRTHP
jgi:hypothetical protein